MLNLIDMMDLLVRAILIPGIYIFIFTNVPEVREDIRKILKLNKNKKPVILNTYHKRAA